MSSEVETSLIIKRRELEVARVAERTTSRDRREDRSPAYDRILVRFPPKLFAVDRMRREDYRIVGKNRDGRFAKSFFAGKFCLSLFCSDE